jgi:hypothetical protein
MNSITMLLSPVLYLYSQCDPDGHEYILLDEIFDHRRTDLAIKLADQKVMRANGRTYLRHSANGKTVPHLG